MRDSNPLFQGVSIHQVVQARGHQVNEAVAAYERNRLLNTPTNDLARYFGQKYAFELPQLDVNGTNVSQEEAMVEVYDHFNSFRSGYRSTISVAGLRVTFTLPFSGDASFFRYQPSRFTSMPPRAEVRGNSLIFQVEGRDLQQAEVKSAIDGFVSNVQQHLGWFGSDVDAFNKQLVHRTSQAIEARKNKLLAAQSLVAGLGYPLRERTDAPTTYAAPQVRRKIEPKPPACSTAPYKPEPVLAEAEYQHILKVCQDMSTVLERSPSAFKGMGEEALRQHFLVQLNGHYEGNATGETFNMEGKTDILIRVDGRNIFIG